MTLEVSYATATDIGLVKKQNEDTVAADPALRLFVVCDGVGGGKGGGVASEIAARIAIETVQRHCQAGAPDAARAEAIAREAVLAASRGVYQRGQDNEKLTGMSTTLDLVWVVGHHAVIAHVGDGRVYLKRDHEFQRLTEDHTFGAIFLKDGTFTREQYEKSPLSSHLARAVGLAEAVQVDVIRTELAGGDVLLMCSDGLVRGMSDSQVDLSIPHPDRLDPKATADQLIQQARANGGKDNASAILIALNGDPAVQEKTAPSVRIKIDALRASEFFRELSYSTLLALLALAEYRELKPGEVLTREGDKPHAIWVILSGRAEVLKGGHAIAVRSAGLTIGEAALIGQEPRSATVVAKDALRVLEFRTDRILAYLGRHLDNPAAQIYRALCRSEHHRLSDTSGKLAEAMTGKG